MNTSPTGQVSARRAAPTSLAQSSEPTSETRDERAARLYAFPGGPLIGWLFDECRRRGQDRNELARCLGVTYGYINQLRSGLRLTKHISDEFAASCARYLGVATVVVKIVAGRIPMSDFVRPPQTEEEAVDSALAAMLDDPVARRALPADPRGLPMSARRSLVAMYIESSGRDLFGLHHLPETVRWLQRAAVIHDESEGAAVRGHRDTLC